MRKTIGLFVVLAAIFLAPKGAHAVELLTNGSFETGNFTGWTVSSTQASNYCTNWTVTTNGAIACLFQSAPTHGTYDAINGFDGSGGQFTMYQDVAIPALMSARLTFRFRAQWSIPTATNQARLLEVQIRNPATNNVLETVYTFTANAGVTNFDNGWVTRQLWISQYAGQSVRLAFVETIPQAFTGPGQMEIDGVQLEAFFPTAAHVGVKGMVTNSSGYGIGNAQVSFVDAEGQTRFARTNPFGHFSFDDVEVGQTYVFEVWHKQYNFVDSPRVVNVDDEINKMIFTAAPDLTQKRE